MLPTMMCFIPSFMLLGIVPAIVSAVFSRALLTMLRGYPESAVQFEHCQQLLLDRTIGLFIGFLRRCDGLSAVAGPDVQKELPAARRIAPLTSEIGNGSHRVQYVKLRVLPRRMPLFTRGWRTEDPGCHGP